MLLGGSAQRSTRAELAVSADAKHLDEVSGFIPGGAVEVVREQLTRVAFQAQHGDPVEAGVSKWLLDKPDSPARPASGVQPLAHSNQ